MLGSKASCHLGRPSERGDRREALAGRIFFGGGRERGRVVPERIRSVGRWPRRLKSLFCLPLSRTGIQASRSVGLPLPPPARPLMCPVLPPRLTMMLPITNPCFAPLLTLQTHPLSMLSENKRTPSSNRVELVKKVGDQVARDLSNEFKENTQSQVSDPGDEKKNALAIIFGKGGGLTLLDIHFLFANELRRNHRSHRRRG